MREWLERETDDICQHQELGITANNCGVMLYRARMQLRCVCEFIGSGHFVGDRGK